MPQQDVGEKTEAPTPRRLQEARDKGQVAKSPDFAAALGLLAGLFMLKLLGPSLAEGFMTLLRTGFTFSSAEDPAIAIADYTRTLILDRGVRLVLPFLAVLFVIAIVGNLLQVGFLFTTQPLMPSLERVSPLAGFKRLFSRRTAVKFSINLAKVGLIACVAFITIRSDLPVLVNLAAMPFRQAVVTAAGLILSLGWKLSAVMFLLGLIDFAYQKYQRQEDLKMTRQEVREEMKRMEGDPMMRQRRQNIARRLAMQRMSQAVPNADVVVTNPTHLAIALKYQQDSMPAPKVVARGAGFLAQRIREIAHEHRVPVLERKPLAQALYKSCQVGDFVPPSLYKAVAEVIAYVFELAGKGYRQTTTQQANGWTMSGRNTVPARTETTDMTSITPTTEQLHNPGQNAGSPITDQGRTEAHQ